MKKSAVETGCAAVVLALSLAGFREALSYQGEAGMMPRGITLLMAGLATLWLLQSIVALKVPEGPRISLSPEEMKAAILLIAAVPALLLGMTFVGFYTTAALLVPAVAFGLGYRNVLGLIVSAGVFLALLYSVFHLLLAVPLPSEALSSVFGG